MASLDLERAYELAAKRPNIKVTSVDVTDDSSLDDLISKHDIVISLIPYIFHCNVIKSAIKFQKDVVTTSYISDEMAKFDESAKKANVMIMNEIGLDPGVDHLYALKTINEVHEEGGKILSFLSYCGGLPAPEASDNPLGYKFSWSSRGVLLALRNSAKFLKDGEVVEVKGSELMHSAKKIDILPALAVVGYANRDSSGYRERYNIPEAKNVLRGTLRYEGFCEFIQALVDLGFLNDEPQSYLTDESPGLKWKEVLFKVLGIEEDNEEIVKMAIFNKIEWATKEIKEKIFSGIRWLGLYSDAPCTKRGGNLLDSLCATLEEKMAYEDGEKDMVLLQHTFEVETKDNLKQTRTSTLIEYGEQNGFTAMAKHVGIPCAVACQLILDGKMRVPGVHAPIIKDIYLPLLKELEAEGIVCKEKIIEH
ncbi:saccharopine dehydrogenase [Neoconidiobolus thromboides FSU 785]|nr:saccharopine dehydrogenase [Neoconidiobolus thromboides FSU 785]